MKELWGTTQPRTVAPGSAARASCLATCNPTCRVGPTSRTSARAARTRPIITRGAPPLWCTDPHTESRDTLRVGPQTLRTSHPPLLSSTRPAIPPPSHRHAHRRGKPTRSGGAALVHVQSPRSHNPQSPLFDGPAARAACFQPSCRRALDVRTSLMRHLMRP